MRQFTLTFLFVVALILNTTGQQRSAFYDAVFLRSIMSVNNEKFKLDPNTRPIFNYYFGKLKDKEFTDSINKNPFLQTYFEGPGIQSVRDGTTIPGLVSSLGGLDVTTIADGLARFIVDRAKKELNSYFFDKFRDRLNSIDELRILFPATSRQLLVIGSEIYNYNAYIASLRESFEKDLSALFLNLPRLMDEPKYSKAFDEFPELRLMLKGSFRIISQLNNDVHPGDILHGFPPMLGKDSVPVNLFSSLQVLDLFSQALRSADTSKYWIDPDALLLLFDTTTFRLFMGLIYQRTPYTIIFKTDNKIISFKEQVLRPLGEKRLLKDFISYKDYIIGFGAKADAVNTGLKGLKSKSSDGKASANDIFYFIDASLDFFDYVVSFTDLPYIPDELKNKKFFGYYYKYAFVARQGGDLYLNISKRDYGAAILNVVNISDSVFTRKLIMKTAQGMSDNLPATSAKGKALTPEKRDAQAEKYAASIQSAWQFFFKYGTFMSNIVSAKTSKEVESIIESVALPAGSSIIKRESRFNVAINSYVGLFVGHEYISGVTDWPAINNYSVSAPIGLSLTWGGIRCSSRPKSPGWGIGGFISVIDIGALASFRITDDTTAAVAPTVELQDVIAPGAFITLNFPKTPFTLAAGAQIGPLLRKIDAVNHEEAKNAYWRIGMTLTVDIPLFNIYNRENLRR